MDKWLCLILILCSTGLVPAGCASAVMLSALEHEAAADREVDAPEAARHRAEAQVLRDQEQRQCAGIPNEERERGPFADPELIQRIEPLRGPTTTKGIRSGTEGAVVYLRAMPCMTEQYLQRSIDCHLAHHRVVGMLARDHGECSMAVADAEVQVHATDSGFAIAIRSFDFSDEVLQRARAAAPRSAEDGL